MDLNNVEFTWIKNKPMNWKIHRVKNHFVLTKNKTDSPEGYPILSLTMRGIIERDISSNEGQLPETYKGYNLLEKDDIVFSLIKSSTDKTFLFRLDMLRAYFSFDNF